MSYDSSGLLSGWIDWGSNIKAFPGMSTHSRYSVTTDGSAYDVATGLTYNRGNLTCMMEFQRGFSNRAFSEKMVYRTDRWSLQTHTVFDLHLWKLSKYDSMLKVQAGPKTELTLWHQSKDEQEVNLGKCLA